MSVQQKKKKIWIINHNAMPPSLGGLNRHHYFAKYLIQAGYAVKVFAASNVHNSGVNMVSGKGNYVEKDCDGTFYTFVRTCNYEGNGLKRIRNMLEFPMRLWGVCKAFVQAEGKPDLVYTSSPDIFACFRAVFIAGKLKVPCVFEVRDLWPESIAAYYPALKWNPVIWALYRLEKWIYQRVDRVIFTMEGGVDYIRDRGWDKSIDTRKVFHINNGVDLEEFDRQVIENPVADSDLDDDSIFKVAYTGSIRHVNELDKLLDMAKHVMKKDPKVRFLIWGDGNQRERLQKRAADENIHNVVFKGRVHKKHIAYILSKCNLIFLHVQNCSIVKYGMSINKFFDYFASGRPVICDLKIGYDLISKYNAGIITGSQNPQVVANSILQAAKMPKAQIELMRKNARLAAADYDYKVLTNKLISLFEGVK